MWPQNVLKQKSAKVVGQLIIIEKCVMLPEEHSSCNMAVNWNWGRILRDEKDKSMKITHFRQVCEVIIFTVLKEYEITNLQIPSRMHTFLRYEIKETTAKVRIIIVQAYFTN